MFSTQGLGQMFMLIVFAVCTVVMLFKRFAADNPEGAKKAAGVAMKVGFGLINKARK